MWLIKWEWICSNYNGQIVKKQFDEDTKKLKELTTNPEAMEKVAREKYFMKKANEDIFIFDE